MTAMRLHRYPSASGGIALGKMGVGAAMFKQGKTARDYVQSGLVAMWDGIENAGWGVHDPNATSIINLMGDNNYPCKAISAQSYLLSTNLFRLSHVYCREYGTVEAVSPVTPIFKGVILNHWVATVNIRGNNTVQVLGDINTGVASNTSKSVSVSYSRQEPASPKWDWVVALDGDIYKTGVVSPNTAFTNLRDLYAGNNPFFCIRLYSRALTADEIAANCAIDKERFNLP